MARIVLKKFKILNSVIIKNMINVMNDFFRVKKSPKMLLHYKTMLGNISTGILIRMGMTSDKNIAPCGFSSPSAPSWVPFPEPSFSVNIFSLFRTLIPKKRDRVCFSNFSTMLRRKLSSFCPWYVTFFEFHKIIIQSSCCVVNNGISVIL